MHVEKATIVRVRLLPIQLSDAMPSLKADLKLEWSKGDKGEFLQQKSASTDKQSAPTGRSMPLDELEMCLNTNKVLLIYSKPSTKYDQPRNI